MTFVFNGKVRWLPVAKFANGGERERCSERVTEMNLPINADIE